jgi:hypothetical protein
LIKARNFPQNKNKKQQCSNSLDPAHRPAAGAIAKQSGKVGKAVMGHRRCEDWGIVGRPQLFGIKEICTKKTPHVDETNQSLQFHLKKISFNGHTQ